MSVFMSCNHMQIKRRRRPRSLISLGFFFFFFWAVPHGMWDSSSLTRDRTCAFVSVESWASLVAQWLRIRLPMQGTGV